LAAGIERVLAGGPPSRRRSEGALPSGEVHVTQPEVVQRRGMDAGTHAGGARELKKCAYVHAYGTHRSAVAAYVAGVRLPGDGARRKRIGLHVGIDLDRDLARILAEAAQHLARAYALSAVALQTARGLSFRLRLGVSVGTGRLDKRHGYGALVVEVMPALGLVVLAGRPCGSARLKEHLDDLGRLDALGDAFHEGDTAELPSYEDLGHRGREQPAVPALEKPEGAASGSRGDIDRVEVHKLVQVPHLGAETESHLDGRELEGYVGVELGKAGVRAEGAAPGVPFFEDGDPEPLLRKVQRSREPGRPGADHGDAPVLGRNGIGLRAAVLRVAKDRPFHVPHGYRFVPQERTLAMLSARLIAQGGHDGGKDGGIAQDLIGGRPPALARLVEEGADIQAKRAGAGAGGRLPPETLSGVGCGILESHELPGRCSDRVRLDHLQLFLEVAPQVVLGRSEVLAPLFRFPAGLDLVGGRR